MLRAFFKIHSIKANVCLRINTKTYMAFFIFASLMSAKIWSFDPDHTMLHLHVQLDLVLNEFSISDSYLPPKMLPIHLQSSYLRAEVCGTERTQPHEPSEINTSSCCQIHILPTDQGCSYHQERPPRPALLCLS